jgi:hypothetical protein
MLEYVPFVPLAQGVRTGVAILSYHGRIAFGITGDWDSVPDIDVLADGIAAGMSELLELSRPADEKVTPRRAKKPRPPKKANRASNQRRVAS